MPRAGFLYADDDLDVSRRIQIGRGADDELLCLPCLPRPPVLCSYNALTYFCSCSDRHEGSASLALTRDVRNTCSL